MEQRRLAVKKIAADPVQYNVGSTAARSFKKIG
jgi:hypothetical protein